MNNIKLGWAGLGNMGKPMVNNLIRAGFNVTVYNRTRSKEKEVVEAGASVADSLQQLADQCDIVFTMVTDDDAVRQIFSGENGILSGSVNGKLAVNMSTISPATSQFIAEACRKKNMAFLEAPVSGSVKPAQEGTLLILAGGEESDYQKAKPCLDVLGKKSMLLGPVGTGTAAKLAINYLLGVNLLGLAETVLFAEQNGVGAEDMLTIINESACGNGITKTKAPSILKNEFPAAFALKLLVKDLLLAKEQGIDVPLFSPVLNSFQDALKEGLGNQDVMAIMQYLRDYPKNETRVFNIL